MEIKKLLGKTYIDGKEVLAFSLLNTEIIIYNIGRRVVYKYKKDTTIMVDGLEKVKNGTMTNFYYRKTCNL